MNLTQLPVTLWEVASSVLKDIMSAMNNCLCNILKETGFDIISRFRDNICLRYAHQSDLDKSMRRGKKKEVDGKVYLCHPGMTVFPELRLKGDKGKFLTDTLNCRSLHINVVETIYYP